MGLMEPEQHVPANISSDMKKIEGFIKVYCSASGFFGRQDILVFLRIPVRQSPIS